MSLLTWLGLAPKRKPLDLGDPAPDLTWTDDLGHPVRLTEIGADSFALIYFFPKADTPGCTTQACVLRDEFEELTARDIRVVGVSADSPEKLQRFKAKYHLPFPLLADHDRRISEAFSVPTILGMTHRQSFLFKNGKLVWRDLRATPKWQARDVLKAAESLS